MFITVDNYNCLFYSIHSITIDSFVIECYNKFNQGKEPNEMFIGREKEISILNQKIASKSFEFGLIYGRRRIGKTRLLIEVAKNNNAIYYVANELGLNHNIKGISETIAAYYDLPYSFTTFEEIFSFLAKMSMKEETIFILDEFTYLLDSDKGILSQLQNIVDHTLSSSQLKLFLSGSHVGMVEDAISYKKPLYGRTTFKMKLEPFDYYDASLFYPHFSNEDKIRLYSVFGGIPFYLVQINDQRSVEENIKKLILKTGAIFEDETSFFLSQEVRSIKSYGNILSAIAAGATRHNEIQSKSGINSPGSFSSFLKTLIELGIVEKQMCFDNANNKRSIYVIKDQFFKFQYKYIEKNKSFKEIMNSDLFYEKFIQPTFENFVSYEFENVCTQFLLRTNKDIIMDLGRYWLNDRVQKKEIEIDIVMKTINTLSVYECKWTNKKIDHRVSSRLIEVSTDLNPDIFGFFSKSGYTDIEKKNEFRFFTPNDLYTL